MSLSIVRSTITQTSASSTIIENVAGLRAAGLASMGYYYFDFRDAKKQHGHGLLSSLLTQLSAQSNPYYDVLSRLYAAHDSGIQDAAEGTLKETLKEMLELPGQGPIYIIIDALDECPNISGMPTPREKVLELVEELIEMQLPNVRICVTSRPEIDIRTVLEPLTSLQVSLHLESGQKQDILDYVTKVVHSDRRMRKWREKDKQLVVNVLSEKADGM
jgi:NACHT domain